MNQSEIDTAIASLIQAFPALADRMVAEFEALTGRKAKRPLPSLELQKVERRLRELADMLEELERLRENPLLPETASELVCLLNRFLRLTLPRIPRGTEPIDHFLKQVKQLGEIPSGLRLGDGTGIRWQQD